MEQQIGIFGRWNGGSTPQETAKIRELLFNIMKELVDGCYQLQVDSVTWESYFTKQPISWKDFDYHSATRAGAINERVETMLSCIKVLPQAEMLPNYAIVVGGDGSMLNVARDLAPLGTAVIGVNQGKVGFITDVSGDWQAERLVLNMINGEHVLEKRSILSCDFKNVETKALNDVVIRNANGRVVEYRVLVDGSLAFEARGDGVIISTPTGSTAYSLAAGGPILAPDMRAVAVVPMHAQSMAQRPIILNSSVTIKIEMVKGDFEVFADGNLVYNVIEGDSLKITESEFPAIFMHPDKSAAFGHPYDHFETLRNKLNWYLQPRR
jgi:NAD+ kinase